MQTGSRATTLRRVTASAVVTGTLVLFTILDVVKVYAIDEELDRGVTAYEAMEERDDAERIVRTSCRRDLGHEDPCWIAAKHLDDLQAHKNKLVWFELAGIVASFALGVTTLALLRAHRKHPGAPS